MDWTEALNSAHTRTHELDILVRLLLAAAAGAAIGMERESKDRPAGLRTNMLVALAAAVFTVLTFEIHYAFSTANSDPVRIIEAVTAGVAFLAAGTIIQSRGAVQGLTTGAAMWMSGALGVCCGAGYYALAVIATVLTVIILHVLKRIEFMATRPVAAKPDRLRTES